MIKTGGESLVLGLMPKDMDMPRKRTKAAKQAQALLVWLESLELPTRVINALRRDLEVITGEREGEEGSGILTGIDQARFAEELYLSRGGQVGKVPTVAKGAIDVLRAVIPAPVSGGSTETAQGGAADSAEAAQPVQSDEPPADAAQEGAEEAQGDEPALESAVQEALPELTDPAPADAPDEQTTDAAPAAPLEPVDAPTAPKRRGRPPRAAAAAAAPPEPVEAPETPARRRGRRPRDEAAAELPPRTRRARVAAASAVQQAVPPAETPALAPVAPAVPPVADPSFAVLLRLWRELHPQGQRAAMHYMASLVVEE